MRAFLQQFRKSDPVAKAESTPRRRNFLEHLHPPRVNARTLRFRTTFGLGLASLTFFAVLVLTGAVLMVAYVPSPERAYGSILDIDHAMTFGGFLRSLHRWSAYGMLLTVALHLLRVAFQGAYNRRALNWSIGLVLLGATLTLAFTGYLLPWDQRAVWATTVSAHILAEIPGLGAPLRDLLLGGEAVGEAALLRAYAFHVFFFPLLATVFLVWHLWRVRRDGGLASSSDVEVGVKLDAAHLHRREVAWVLTLLAAVSLVADLWPASLGALADLHKPDNPEKAPWFFVGAQELVSYSAFVGGVLVPAVCVSFLAAIPFLDRDRRDVGRLFGSPSAAMSTAAAAVLAGVVFAVGVWLELSGERTLDPGAWMLVLGVVLFLAMGALTGSARAAVQAALVVLAVSLLGFTLVGLCRGPDWVFTLPWEVGANVP